MNKAAFYKIQGDMADLTSSAGLFILSDDDQPRVVVHNPADAFLQNDYPFIDLFPKDGGDVIVSLKLKQVVSDVDGVMNVWTTDF